jgi:succinate-semialdehyde dehydrogenase / glutarate-semialdehyde dehydrogenase
MKLTDPTLLKSQCLINGEWRGEPVDPVTNPATGARLGAVPRFGAAETTEAVEAAEKAFGPWSKVLAKERARILRRWAELIIQNKEDLALILTSEQGKPLAEARGEIDIGAAYIEYSAEEGRRVYGETIPTHRSDARILVIKQPIGVCAAITPWNFPASMITRKIAPALAVGCTVVIKPAPDTPLTALALVELANRAGLPAGTVNIVTGDAPAIGKVMCEHPSVRFVGFTGSTEVGKTLMRQAASGVKKMGLELGGNAPLIVFDDADIDAAVEGAMVSKYRNMGQTCVCANRIYVQDAVFDAFVEKFAVAVKKLVVGDGAMPGVTQGPLINERAVQKVESHVQDVIDKGGKIVVGGKRHALGGTYFEPTVMTGINETMRVTREETFGPLAPVYRFKTEDEVVRLANASQYGLAAYFFSRDLGRVWRVSEALEFGMVGVNSGLITSEAAPFGGVKESGLGREGSHHGLDEFLEVKYVMMAGL